MYDYAEQKSCIKTNVSEEVEELNICRSHIENISIVQLCRVRHYLQSIALLVAKHFPLLVPARCCEPV